jgi:hypothetical protein
MIKKSNRQIGQLIFGIIMTVVSISLIERALAAQKTGFFEVHIKGMSGPMSIMQGYITAFLSGVIGMALIIDYILAARKK